MSNSGKEGTTTGHISKSDTDRVDGAKMAPVTSKDIDVLTQDMGNSAEAASRLEGRQPEQNESRPFFLSEEQLKTPKSEHTPSSESRSPGFPLESHHRDQTTAMDVGATPSQSQDYFATKLPNSSEYEHTASAMPMLSSRNCSPSLGGTPATNFSTTSSPSGHSLTWKEFSAQPKISPSYHSHGTPRPTSVPNFQANPASRRREGPDYPKYPDQSFKALESQHYPTSYRPSSPHPLRTRSSHLSHKSSFSSTDNRATSDLPHFPSGAKTAGNTPAQSPGLFSPIPPNKKSWPSESNDGRSATPTLHPTHHKPPKETHKLLKDIDPISGRKTINHYEIFQKLGSGQHGTVKQGRDLQNGEMVAIKIVRRFSKKLRLGRSGDPNDMIKKEVAILKKARHPHVVSLIEVIDDAEFGKVYLVLEYVERGEIIWRKQTDKDIAAFEMARTQREIANNVNEEFERAAVIEFNSKAPARHSEKLRIFEKQKREAKERFGAQGYHSIGQPSSDFWSLEFETDIGDDTGLDAQSEFGNPMESELHLTDKTFTANTVATSAYLESPNHTPKSSFLATEAGSAPTSVPSSRPDTPGMYGAPNLEEKFSNDALQSTLDEIIAGQTQWTPDEEDFRYVPCLTLSQALEAFRDTVLGLEYLHYQGIIHRDIKPANLLWTTDYRVKISDFGVSYLGKPIREDDNKEEMEEADSAVLDEALELAKTVGTPAFYAPELCDPQYFETGKQPDRPAITGQIDVWALGVTLYGMIFGRLPFWHFNEFQMYERISREELFIPRFRLRGVSHTDKTPSNHDKRLEDVLEYEEVDDELRDLLKRLLHKQPAKRITLKEVKHHPWVLRGISDQMSWVDETDPLVQSQGRKIEVSTQEVQDAVVGLTLVDRVKAGFQRVGSVLRGRGSRKRADSNPKASDSNASERKALESGVFTLEKVPTNVGGDGRRSSLRGDEQIYTALRASRENSEHPLAQSVAASPELETDSAFFDPEKRPRPVSDPQATRPSLNDRTLSTADSMRTIRAPPFTTVIERVASNPDPDDLCTTTAIPDPNASSSSSLSGIFGGAGRRFVNSMRSRERGTGRQSPSQSSRSSSADRDRETEDPHASPSLALSSVIAAGHVDQPLVLREDPETSQPRPTETNSEAFQRAREMNRRRQTLDFQRHARRPTVSIAAEVACPPSPDDEIFFSHQRPASAADSTSAFQISSSSDQIVSGESTPHSRIPSVVSGASSLSAAVDEDERYPLTLAKPIPPFTIRRRSASQMRAEKMNDASNPALAPAAAEEEAGYNGDSDSDDEGLMIG